MLTGNRTVLLLCSVYHTNHKMSSTSDFRIESEGSELKLPETATAEQLESERGLKIQSSARITPLTCRQGKGPPSCVHVTEGMWEGSHRSISRNRIFSSPLCVCVLREEGSLDPSRRVLDPSHSFHRTKLKPASWLSSVLGERGHIQ